MDGEQNGTQTQQNAQQQEQRASQQQANQQETQARNAADDRAAGNGVDAAAYEAQLAERDSRIAEFGAGEVGGCTIGSVSVLFFQIKCNVFEQWASYGVR